MNEIVKESNYYPFGLSHKGYNNNVSSLGNSVAKRYMFGGKEYQEDMDLNWYDVTARNYDPALGRWMNLDPLAEQMRRHSPYNYAFDNPVYFVDPDGMMPFGSGNPITRALNRAKSAAKAYVRRKIDNAIEGVAKAAKSFVNRIESEVSAEGKVTTGFQVAAQVSETAGFDANLLNVELASAKIGGKATSEGIENVSDLHIISEDGEFRTESALEAGITTPAGVGGGAGIKHTATTKFDDEKSIDENSNTDSDTSKSGKILIGPVAMGVTRGDDYTAASIEIGGKAAVIFGIEGLVKIEVKLNDKDQDE